MPDHPPRPADRRRVRVEVRGAVQGVGFRPYVYWLATELQLAGWVRNDPAGVQIEVEGQSAAVDAFLRRLPEEKPPPAGIEGVQSEGCCVTGESGFEIRESQTAGPTRAVVLPDIATCGACREEVFDPGDRRYRYPFTNCSHCGPRFSIVLGLPYDRDRTTMRGFEMCEACRREYEDPRDRRFHAQPNACPACGPRLDLWDGGGKVLAETEAALRQAVEAVRAGAILALKGLGGFQLVVDAGNEAAVRRLRCRKHREAKPLAVMAASMEAARGLCRIEAEEARLLGSPEGPMVLLRRHVGAPIAEGVAPENPYLGLMLPNTALHHLLLRDLGRPAVVTSGNRSDEPICTDEREALSRLGGIADLFLVHNRPIARQVDDSVVRMVLGEPLLLRRARGYAPLSLNSTRPVPAVLAVGAHLKNTIAVGAGDRILLSQHLGDLETEPARAALEQAAVDLPALTGIRPEGVVCDLHPDYASTLYAEARSQPRVRVQHHLAHVLSGAADNGLEGPVMGIAWDGSGYGEDGTVWGGEFLRVDGANWERRAHLRTYPLPGGDRAAREPRRAALGLLYELYGESAVRQTDLFTRLDLSAERAAALLRMAAAGVNSPRSSSAGRLFDGVAALLGLCAVSGYEGQAASLLEFASEEAPPSDPYPFQLLPGEGRRLGVDWGTMIERLLEELQAGVPNAVMAARFHATLAEMMAAVAERVGEERVLLTGGCFQNAYLTACASRRLSAAGFQVYRHRRVPPNDGGIAVGQVMAAAYHWTESEGAPR